MLARNEPLERHTLSVVVDNEAGVLARIVGLFSSRGYNIESLTVADVSADHAVSRITVVTTGTAHVIEQIIAQLEGVVSSFVRDEDGRISELPPPASQS